uniref:Oxysterol-binding protein 2 n=1 Tax=Sphaerodactylus townsendi TaxID=933632 RepID=A0ACB8FYM9_9SAUR
MKPTRRNRGWKRSRGLFDANGRQRVVALEEGKDYEGYIPLWFERKVDPATGELICVYKGGYWEAREKQDWSMCPDIF